MKKYRGRKPKAGSFTLAFLGLGICFLSFLILGAVGSGVLMLTKNPIASIAPAFIIIFLLSAAVSGFINSKLSEGSDIGGALVSGGMLVLMLLIASLIAEHGKVGFGVIINYVCYMLVTLLFALLAKKKGSKHRKRH